MILLLQSYPGANAAVARHYPYYVKSGADKIVGVGTTGGGCEWPEGMESVEIGENKYLDGVHLPNRLLDTLQAALAYDYEHILIAEYDVVFLNPVRFNAMEHAVASHLAGFQTWGSLAERFYHNPWLWHREAAANFIAEGRKVIEEGICKYGSAESSPDVFFGLVCQRIHQPVQEWLWKEFSRNSLDLPGHLDLARDAYRSGIDVIHGIKSEAELRYITT